VTNEGDHTYAYLKRQERPSVVQHVINCLTEAMITRQLSPGDKIPTEAELSEQLGVARNSVREAIKMLTFLGVLEIRRPEGTFVCDGYSESLLNPLIYGIILQQGNSYNQLIEMREMMEVGVMRLAIEKASNEDVERVHAQLLRLKDALLRQPPNVEQANLEDNRFHDMIDEICQNDIVSRVNGLVRTLTYQLRYETTARMVLSGRGQEHYEAHLHIYETLKNKDTHGLNRVIRDSYFITDII